LGTALRRGGHDVQPLASGALFLVKSPVALRASVIHFQWFEVLVVSAYLPWMVLKALVFLAQAWLCKGLGKRLVWTAHNTMSHEACFPRLERWVVKRIANLVDGIIVHCEVAKTEIGRYVNIKDDGKIFVVDHGNYIGAYPADISRADARQALALGADDMIVLFLGSIRPYKGVAELVAAFKNVQRAGVKLLIAGRPMSVALQRDLESQCADCSSIIFRPQFVPEEDVQKYFQASDLVAFPYRRILASGAVVLAMSFGRACLAPRIGCLPSILGEEGGFLYEPGVGTLQQALADGIKRRSELQNMGVRNLERARRFDWDAIAARTAQVYSGTCNHSAVTRSP
jgi:glycosyltransferase involved in cell wall biosynthesis